MTRIQTRHRRTRRPALLVPTAVGLLTVGSLLLAGCSNPAGPGTAGPPSVIGSAAVAGTGIDPSANSVAYTAPTTVPATSTSAALSTTTAASTSIAAPAIPVAPATVHGATKACALVTEQEATAALGADPGPGQETPLGDTASACSYLAGPSSLQLSLTPSGGKAVYERERAGIPSGTAGITDVSGVGDGAFSQLKGARGAINFDKGDAMVVIGLSTGGTPPTQDQLTQLATAAAGRI